MLLKTLFEDYDLNLTKILYKHESALGLSFDELNILNALVYYYKDKKTFSLSLFAKKVNAPKAFIEEKIIVLINKELIKMDALTDNQKKIKELINYEPLFEKLSEIIEAAKSNIVDPENIKKVTELFEYYIQRPLTSIELVELKALFTKYEYKFDQVKKILLDLAEKNNLTIYSFRDKIINEG
jgi:DNA replication protein DnaD